MARVDAPMTEHACTHWPCPICDSDLIALSTDDLGVVRMPTSWWAGETGFAEPRVTRHEPEDDGPARYTFPYLAPRSDPERPPGLSD